METVGSFEARTPFSERTARVEAGERVVVTHHDEPVAGIMPIREARAERAAPRLQVRRALQAGGCKAAKRGRPNRLGAIPSGRAEGRR